MTAALPDSPAKSPASTRNPLPNEIRLESKLSLACPKQNPARTAPPEGGTPYKFFTGRIRIDSWEFPGTPGFFRADIFGLPGKKG